MKNSAANWLLALIFVAPATCMAQGADPTIPRGEVMTPIERNIARAIYRVIPMSNVPGDEFLLMPQSDAHENVAPTVPNHFVFFGRNLEQVRIECSEGAILRILHGGSTLSAFSISNCSNARAGLVEAMKSGPDGVEAMKSFLAAEMNLKGPSVERAGLYYRARKTAGTSEYYVPILFTGYDALVVENVVLIDERGAWIVSSQLGSLCRKLSTHPDTTHPLCTNTEDVLSRIARDVRAELKR